MKIRVSKVKEDKGELRGLLLSFLLLLAAVVAFGTGSLGFLNRTGERSQETLRKAIARGCVQCYAIEGRYPPSVEYLEENYDLTDHRGDPQYDSWQRCLEEWQAAYPEMANMIRNETEEK